MKRVIPFLILAIGMFAAVSNDCKAQTSNTVSKSIATADTITWNTVGSKVRAFQYTATKSSGTVAGKVYLEATVNGTWVILDSITLSDVTTPQTKVTVVNSSTGTTYKGYRYRNTNTSSATISVVAAYLRRVDE